MWWVFKIARACYKRVVQRVGVCRQVWPTKKLHLICWDVVAHNFRNLTLVSLFAQASRSQEDAQESRTHLLKLDACDRAILSTFVDVFAKSKLCLYVHLSM